MATERIYVIGIDPQTPPYWIGRGRNLEGRLRSLQQGNPNRLRILFEGQKEGHSIRALERRIRNRITSYWTNGQWYDLPYVELMNRIVESICRLDHPVDTKRILRNWRRNHRNQYNRYMRDYRRHNATTYRRMLRDDPMAIWFPNMHENLEELQRATPQWVDVEAIRAIYSDCISQSINRRANLSLIHPIPIRHESVCGLHVVENLQLVETVRVGFDANAVADEQMEWLRQQGLAAFR